MVISMPNKDAKHILVVNPLPRIQIIIIVIIWDSEDIKEKCLTDQTRLGDNNPLHDPIHPLVDYHDTLRIIAVKIF